MTMCDCNQGRLPCTCKKTPPAVAEFALIEERPKLRARLTELEHLLSEAADWLRHVEAGMRERVDLVLRISEVLSRNHLDPVPSAAASCGCGACPGGCVAQAAQGEAVAYKDDPRTSAELSLAGCRCVRFGEGNPHWPCNLHPAPSQPSGRVPEGWKLMPLEPDEDILEAIHSRGYVGDDSELRDFYRFVLAVAPTPDTVHDEKIASDAFQTGPAPSQPSGRVPECVQAWYDAKLAHLAAVDAYNARLEFIRQHMPFGTAADPEYRIMTEAENKERELRRNLFSGLREWFATPTPDQSQSPDVQQVPAGAREAFNAEYDKLLPRPITIREIAWRMWQAGTRRAQSASAVLDDQAYDDEAERMTAEALGPGAGINPAATSIDDLFLDGTPAQDAAAHPMQPIVVAEKGVIRFKQNGIVSHLLDYAIERGCGLNELARMEFSDEDRMQLAQLIGMSVSTYGGMSYASPESVALADGIAERLAANGKPSAEVQA